MREHGWNKPVKTIMLHPEQGKIRTELPAIDILREPNRHQFESIIKAMSVCIFELVQLEQDRSERMMGLMQNGGTHEPVQNTVREGDHRDSDRRDDNLGGESRGSTGQV